MMIRHDGLNCFDFGDLKKGELIISLILSEGRTLLAIEGINIGQNLL